MTPCIVYCCGLDAPDEFKPSALRWANTWRQFPPNHPHHLKVVWCNGSPDASFREIFTGIEYEDFNYSGSIWDISTYQVVSRYLCEYDLVVFMNARTHFNRYGWLARLMAGISKRYHPNALYGCSTSYEQCPHLGQPPNPHVRTACFATSPSTFNRYPYVINDRLESFRFESGAWNFMQWYEDMGYPVWMVTWSGEYLKSQWRKVPNVFRSGDQSDLLVCDRHTDIYLKTDPVNREHLRRLADGLAPKEAIDPALAKAIANLP